MRFRLLRRNLLALLGVSVVLVTLLFSARVLVLHEDGDSGGQNRVRSGPVRFNFGSVSELSRSVYSANYRQTVLNQDRFPGDPQLVVVVQVHNRPEYLQMLIRSLRDAAEVHSFLLVFSHDFFSEEIQDLVRRISFCRVLQVYFPFSSQLYPGQFPGQDPRDCPRDASPQDALRSGCLNAQHPDSYGHYRECAVTQPKHHWWWKLHFVFERVHVLQGYSGFVVFLEEDNYVLPDFFHFFRAMLELRRTRCPDCDLLALGNHDGVQDFSRRTNRVLSTGWRSTRHNLGLALSRELYYRLMGCSRDFCTYDDYNWDWTLQHLSGTCIPKPLRVLAALGSRVLHTGDCGLHQRARCRPDWASRRVEESLQRTRADLFPADLVLSGAEPAEHEAHMKNGGWGDVRDHSLCQNYNKLNY